MKSRFFRRGFTLAEIMIVLMVIGIISAILLPIARHATPDENVLKFKKANATLGNVIRELVTSDKYYLNGDLGTRADGTLIDGSHDGDGTYFCQSFADLINTKSVTCSEVDTGVSNTEQDMIDSYSLESLEWYFDYACKVVASKTGPEITTNDSVVYYQTGPTYTFGYINPYSQERLYTEKKDGFLRHYKMFCIDIDGIPEGASRDECINECPFGYGIRTDGQIRYGKRANEWIQKSIQNKD